MSMIKTECVAERDGRVYDVRGTMIRLTNMPGVVKFPAAQVRIRAVCEPRVWV